MFWLFIGLEVEIVGMVFMHLMVCRIAMVHSSVWSLIIYVSHLAVNGCISRIVDGMSSINNGMLDVIPAVAINLISFTLFLRIHMLNSRGDISGFLIAETFSLSIKGAVEAGIVDGGNFSVVIGLIIVGHAMLVFIWGVLRGNMFNFPSVRTVAWNMCSDSGYVERGRNVVLIVAC